MCSRVGVQNVCNPTARLEDGGGRDSKRQGEFAIPAPASGHHLLATIRHDLRLDISSLSLVL